MEKQIRIVEVTDKYSMHVGLYAVPYAMSDEKVDLRVREVFKNQRARAKADAELATLGIIRVDADQVVMLGIDVEELT